MESRPVSRHDAPSYPTRREFLASGAVTVGVLGFGGCGRAQAETALVAPVFKHGEGRGATGCIVMSPPVFLSEEEALQTIKEELSKVGIKLGEGMPLPDVRIDYEDPFSKRPTSERSWLGEPAADTTQPGELDAVDRERRVAVEIITSGDHSKFRRVISSAVSYDTHGLAQHTADCIRDQLHRDLRVGIFYDPLECRNFEVFDSKKRGEKKVRAAFLFGDPNDPAKIRAREQLRRQVQDFIVWLEKTDASCITRDE